MSVAIKQLHQVLEDGDRHTFIKELAMHRSLVHPNVVQLLGVCQEPLCLVMEFMSRGSLFACLQQTSIEMPWQLRLSCALDVARAMAFLHAKDILHRDLKSLNVLVNEDWRCKVADFDQSRAVADTLTAIWWG
mmetsp:Transcript_70148/g.165042  ORF Transcript_70148/g.165042 Transcript_70148/m.165042 type:complete len:133 (-) Transcript_70148:23-421(-)